MAGVQIIYDTTCISTSDTTCTWVVPTGVCRVTFEIWGGGGGGGNKGTNCDCCSRGGPGSGGGYSKVTIDTVPGSSYTVVAGKAGVSSQGYGSYCGICCDGCTGGTSYVSGTGLTSFCATGGYGGKSDFTTNCYSHCGCNFYTQIPGCGYGTNATVAKGMSGITTRYGDDNPYNIVNLAGGAGGPGGGAGGFNHFGGYNNSAGYCALIGEHSQHGRIPGGGGAGSGGYSDCVCTPYPSGRGAPGLVKIIY